MFYHQNQDKSLTETPVAVFTGTLLPGINHEGLNVH